MPTIVMGKTRPVDQPWLIFEAGTWEWRVLKSYQNDNANKPGARWFCSVRSPHTFGGADLGDVYVRDIINAGARETFRDPSLVGLDLYSTKRAPTPMDLLFG